MQNVKRKKLTSKQISNLIELFKHISSQKGEEKITALKYLDDKGVDIISESIYNLLYNENLNDILTKNQKRQLIKIIGPNLYDFETIAKRNISGIRRKNKIIKFGSGIGTILLSLIPVISSLFLKKNKNEKLFS